MIFKGPGFLAVLWFGSSPTPSPLTRQQVVSVFLCVVAGRAYRREKGEGSEGEAKPENNEWIIEDQAFSSSYDLPPLQTLTHPLSHQ